MPPKIVVCLLLFVFWSTACQSEEEPLISEEKMINILIDVHIAEAAMQGLDKAQKDSLVTLYYHQIYEIHSIDEADFKWQMEYMKHHPEYMEKVYEKVLDEISRREAELKL